MTARYLSDSFALQSPWRGLVLSQVVAQGRGLAGLIEADRYPASSVLRIAGLLPSRHYVLRGAADGFCRTAADGTAPIDLAVDGPTLLLIVPVI